MKNKKKCIVIYNEGETEDEFYKLVLDEIKIKYKLDKFNVDKIVKKCLKGITKFDKKLLKIYERDIKTQYKGYEISVYLCYDTDVFEYEAKPPADWENVEKELKKMGANNVYHIKAEKCIEDYFLIDLDGICDFLKIKKVKRVSGKNGVEKMKKLFKEGNRIYQKGFSCGKLVKSLNIKMILNEIEDVIKPLIDKLI